MRKQRKRRRQNVRLAGVPCSDTLLDLQLMKIHFLEVQTPLIMKSMHNVSLSKSAPASPRPMANDDAWTAELFIRLKTVYYKSLCERLARLCYKNERLRRFEKSKQFPKMLYFGSWMAGSSEKKSSPTSARADTEHKSFCVRPKW